MSRGRLHRKKSKFIVFLSGIISLFIALCMAIILLSVLLKGGILNEKLFRQTLSESAYFDNKIDGVLSSVRDKLVSAGLPEDMIDSVITRTDITLEANKKIKSSKSDLSDSTSNFEDKLRENIYEYIGGTGIPVTDNIKKSVEPVIIKIARDYDTHMNFLFARLYNDFHDKYAHVFDTLLYISVAVLIICAVIAVLLHSRKYRGLRYVGYGILAGSAVMEAVSVILRFNLREMLPDNKTEYYNFINTFIDRSFSQDIYMCLAGVLLFSLVSLMTFYMKKQVI